MSTKMGEAGETFMKEFLNRALANILSKIDEEEIRRLFNPTLAVGDGTRQPLSLAIRSITVSEDHSRFPDLVVSIGALNFFVEVKATEGERKDLTIRDLLPLLRWHRFMFLLYTVVLLNRKEVYCVAVTSRSIKENIAVAIPELPLLVIEQVNPLLNQYRLLVEEAEKAGLDLSLNTRAVSFSRMMRLTEEKMVRIVLELVKVFPKVFKTRKPDPIQDILEFP